MTALSVGDLVRGPERRRDLGCLYFYCGEEEHPGGGMITTYRHVELLARMGVRATVIHDRRGYRCPGLSLDTPVSAVSDVRLDPSRDILVLPEVVGPQFDQIGPGCPKVIFNQGTYLTFSRWPLEPVKNSPYRSPDVVGVVCVSEDSEAYLRYTFPWLHVQRIFLSIPTELFQPGVKEKTIALMPRKSALDLGQVLAILSSRGELDGWRTILLHNVSRSDVAKGLAHAAIFLSSGYQESFPLAILEAMASGCLVVGYDGFGAREYFNEATGVPVPCGDTLTFARRLAEVMKAWESSDARIATKVVNAIAVAQGAYTAEREAASLVACWESMLIRVADRHEGEMQLEKSG